MRLDYEFVCGLMKASLNYLSCMHMHGGSGKASRIVFLRTVNSRQVWSGHEPVITLSVVETSKHHGPGDNAGSLVASLLLHRTPKNTGTSFSSFGSIELASSELGKPALMTVYGNVPIT